MGLLSKLFSSTGDPVRSFTDPVLGVMTWSDPEEGWVGQFNSFKYCINQGTKTPNELVLVYAREILNDPDWLNGSLADAKAKYKSKLSPKMLQDHSDEVDELTWDVLNFGLRRNVEGEKRWILATLMPGREYRCWRTEYLYRDCYGLGFDT